MGLVIKVNKKVFTYYIMAPKFKSIFSSFASTGATAAEAGAKRGDVLFRNIDNAADLKTSIKSVGDANDLILSIGKSADTLTLTTKQSENLAAALEPFAKDSKSIMSLTDSSAAEVAKASAAATTFFQRNEKKLLAIGLGVGGIAALMLLTGESDPIKAVGDSFGDLAGAAGEGLGEGLGAAGKGFSDGLGIGEFFSSWGLYIGIFCAILLMLGVFMMLK